MLSFLGAVAGGAIGGALISTVSYVVGSAIGGNEITGEGLLNAAMTGAVCGAIGAAIGTISLATATATVVAKGVASAGLGAAIGIKAGIESGGPPVKRLATGVAVGTITALSTFAGARIDAFDEIYGFAGNLFTNFSATLFCGTGAEIASVASQEMINSMADSSFSFTPPPFWGKACMLSIS